MNIESVTVEKADLHRLLSTGSGDAVMLYLYIRSGNLSDSAEKELGLTGPRLSCAAATLRQLGLWPEERKNAVISGEKPVYSEKDVLSAMDTDGEFRLLYGEVQRLLGRTLNTEELKILLSFVRYLGLPTEVISVLVSYCRDRARQKGSPRNPSLRTIEKEAYHWAEEGIDTLEEAAAYIHARNQQNSRVAHLMSLLQIRGRSLTAAEEKYATAWLDMGFEDAVITMAYEKTCLNTGGLSWPYMNKILTSWKKAGLLTARQVKEGDWKGASSGQRQLDEDERAAIARMMQEV
jgi:DnaD/phage-associated family protein